MIANACKAVVFTWWVAGLALIVFSAHHWTFLVLAGLVPLVPLVYAMGFLLGIT